VIRAIVLALLSLLNGSLALADAKSECTNASTSPDQRIVTCSEVIRADARADWPYYNRGLAYRGKGDYDRAIADYNKFIEINPKFADVYNNRGIAYEGKGDHDRAIADYTESIRLGNSKPHLPYNNRGFAYQAKGDNDRAIADYTKAIAIDPKDANYYDGRGDTYNDRGNLDLAIADYTRAIELEPKNPNFTLGRGYARFNNGDFKNASTDPLRVIEQVDDIDPMLFRYLARSHTGEEAASELEANAGRLKTKEWPYAAAELYLGKRSPAATLDAAAKPRDRCEAQFYIGECHKLKGNAAEAATALKAAVDSCAKISIQYRAAIAELKRLKP
jgi:lipoprotein NlpI